jgi:hypothetical protein
MLSVMIFILGVLFGNSSTIGTILLSGFNALSYFYIGLIIMTIFLIIITFTSLLSSVKFKNSNLVAKTFIGSFASSIGLFKSIFLYGINEYIITNINPTINTIDQIPLNVIIAFIGLVLISRFSISLSIKR